MQIEALYKNTIGKGFNALDSTDVLEKLVYFDIGTDFQFIINYERVLSDEDENRDWLFISAVEVPLFKK